MRKNKVEIYDEYVIKYNTADDSKGLEKFTEVLGVNFRRELRVYSHYASHKFSYLLIPNLLEKGSDYIKMEKLTGIPEKIQVNSIILNLKEFLMIGINEKKLELFDFISSPAVSVIRGSLYGVMMYGPKIHFRMIFYILKLMASFKYHKKFYLIHKDLKTNQNMINTTNGVYFFDFGSSVLTKRYFLTDVIELSIDFENLEFDISPTVSLLQSLGFENDYLAIAKMQIQIILYKRFLHLHKRTKKDFEYMKKVRSFVDNIYKLSEDLERYDL